MNKNKKLGVNIDHIATLGQVRKTTYPSLLEAVKIIEQSGADSITLHLREDRRHIQDADVYQLKEVIRTKMNLEMAPTDEMVAIACQIKPEDCCLVPEKRAELTTEGGLDVVSEQRRLSEVCGKLSACGIRVSLFIDADLAQVEAAKNIKAPLIEIHTGHYANAQSKAQSYLLSDIINVSRYAKQLGLQVNAGHGLHLGNTFAIAKIADIVELNIGHAIIARALFVGLAQAVNEMKALITNV